MDIADIATWVTIVTGVASLGALAWSAVAFVLLKRQEAHHSRFVRFFEVTEMLGKQGGSIASKVAAAFELRRYPEYREVIIRICEEAKVEGDAAELLRNELRLTATSLRK